MRIAFVNQPWNRVEVPVGSGSIAIWTYEVARRLAASHEVIVYSKRDADQPSRELHDGVAYRRLSVRQDVALQRIGSRIPVGFFKKALRFDETSYFLGYVLRIAADLRTQHCDVVHVHNFSQFVPILRRFNPTCRTVLHMHCEWLTQIDRNVIDKRLRSVDRIVGCSEFVTEKIRDAFPSKNASCSAVRNGVDVDRFRPLLHADGSAPVEPRILFVGRVSPEKGVHVLLDAFARVSERHPAARLEIVGGLGAAPREFIVEGSDDPRVAGLDRYFAGDYVARLKKSLPPSLAGKVTFLGELPYTHLVKKYHGAQIFVYPSVWNEPFGLPVVEAMACGLPVVATRSGGLQEIVDHKVTGLLVERDNSEELAGALIELLSDASARRKMGTAGRGRVTSTFAWERVADELAGLYQKLGRGSD